MALGVIVGHRGVFPENVAKSGRDELLGVLRKRGVEFVAVSEKETGAGAIENHQEAKACAELFKKNRERINGVLISLPNFGDERAAADTLKMAGLDVPVFVQAYPDDLDKMRASERRDSFCGKFSVCNNLRQYGIQFTLGKSHVVHPESEEFARDLDMFLAVCRVVTRLKKARIGCIGARTTPFKTVRYSEKLLERSGISVDTIDLSEIVHAFNRMDVKTREVEGKLTALKSYCAVDQIPAEALEAMAKVAVAIENWTAQSELDAVAIQCWPAMQDAFGIFPCTIMSMLGNSLIPAACETDVMGAVSMLTLQSAGQAPCALFDWNNNYGDDPDRMIFFHCSNMPAAMLDNARMTYNYIAEKIIGRESSYGTCIGDVKTGPITLARVTSDDVNGCITAFVGEGEFTDDPLETFGGVTVARIPRLQELLRWLCANGFEHHVAVGQYVVGDALNEAFANYLGWETHLHR